MYESVVKHEELGKFKTLKARDPNELAYKTKELKSKWDHEYRQKCRKERGIERAKKLTELCGKTHHLIEHYLTEAMLIDYASIKKVDDKLPNYTQKYKKITYLTKPNLPQYASFKDFSWNLKIVNLCLIATLFPFVISMVAIGLICVYGLLNLLIVFTDEAQSFVGLFFTIFLVCVSIRLTHRFSKKMMKKWFVNKINRQNIIRWENDCKRIDSENRKIEEKNRQLKHDWEESKQAFFAEEQKKRNALNKPIIDYELGNLDKLTPYFHKTLDLLPKLNVKTKHNVREPSIETEIEYNGENHLLVINYPLPDFEEFVKIPKEVKYIASKDKIVPSFYSGSMVKKRYDSLIYQIIFSVVYSIFTGDKNRYVESVIINGLLDSIDRSIGKRVVICLSSLHITRKEFETLDLYQIEPKECFKRLKGVAGVQMEAKTPIAPIMQISKDDKRFVESYEVIKSINDGTNLAAMDWKDFENLIRELFEWKFGINGGECKITQASRDGGVDAIAYNPDPILGGKTIIQAKRYTNIVGVSAVRDLYGTLINEGASKAILITTSDYGSDAHKFAKGKPITLLNGNNLLHLLREMGTKAYIDVQEAKTLLH